MTGGAHSSSSGGFPSPLPSQPSSQQHWQHQPRQDQSFLGGAPPPPPPPLPMAQPSRQNLTDHDISSFMSEYGCSSDQSTRQDYHYEPQARVAPEPPPAEKEPEFNSALAKLRAKKAEKRRREMELQQHGFQNSVPPPPPPGLPQHHQKNPHHGAPPLPPPQPSSSSYFAKDFNHEDDYRPGEKRRHGTDDSRERLKRLRQMDDEDSKMFGAPRMGLHHNDDDVNQFGGGRMPFSPSPHPQRPPSQPSLPMPRMPDIHAAARQSRVGQGKWRQSPY